MTAGEDADVTYPTLIPVVNPLTTHPSIAGALAARGVVLVGIDTPSVDPYDDHAYQAHRALVAAGVMWLEGLVLAGVPEGPYELIALPLRLAGFDASPVRAILRENGLPEDLVYIAMIESAFKSQAHSRAAAKGYWQFISGTAKRYGLKATRENQTGVSLLSLARGPRPLVTT